MIKLRTKEGKPDEADGKSCFREFFYKVGREKLLERSSAAEKEGQKQEPEAGN